MEIAKQFLGDHYDTYLLKENPGSRTLCSHRELDSQSPGSDSYLPFSPGGTYDGKVVNSTMAKKMTFAARWGAACGMPFNAAKFLGAHPQFDWMIDLLKDRPARPWTEFQGAHK